MAERLRIRRLTTMEEFRGCAELQKEIWGFPDLDVLPPRWMKVGSRTGALTLGAYDARGRLVAFLHGFPGELGRRRIHCSHMLGVRSGLRDRSVGFRLKREQWRFALGRGLDLVTWTFDPLESRNAWLNLHKLGVVCSDYLEDAYGRSDAGLHRGLATDRFLVRWPIRSARVRRRMTAGPPEPRLPRGARAVNEVERGRDGVLRCGRVRLPGRAPALLVAIPLDVQALKTRDLAAAVAWRERTRAIFNRAFARGWVLEDYVPGPRAEGVGFYVLKKRY
jgi:predicted GNAT superfamily acetyltransferase